MPGSVTGGDFAEWSRLFLDYYAARNDGLDFLVIAPDACSARMKPTLHLVHSRDWQGPGVEYLTHVA